MLYLAIPRIKKASAIYIGGTVFVLDVDKPVILAFDVDDETVMEMDGRLYRLIMMPILCFV